MLAVKLAWRNLIGRGFRTWLSAFILSLSYLVIIWHRGFMIGWERQAYNDTIKQEIGGGQYYHKNYDSLDPFTFSEAHGELAEIIRSQIKQKKMVPILISKGTLYSHGRPQTVIMKGIDIFQNILELPTEFLDVDIDEIPIMVGMRMAKSNKLEIDDVVTVRWRDARGTFDATEGRIVQIFDSNVPTIDQGQIWLPIKNLRKMKQMSGEATIVVTANDHSVKEDIGVWEFKDHKYLMQDLENMMKIGEIEGYIFWLIFLSLAWLSIFDIQVLAIFHRQKEIGTDIALGMTRGQVITLFTIEGAMHGILAGAMAVLYGAPLLYLQHTKGVYIPAGTDQYGFAISERLYPYYGLELILISSLLTFLSVVIISYLPTRKIAKLKPTNAIKGKAL